MAANCIKYTGGCHCGAVRFEVMAPSELDVINCNICVKKGGNLHFIVPDINFTLLKGQESLSCYTFNTHQAKHTFCKICGVQSFYTPRSNPDGKGVIYNCLDPPDDGRSKWKVKFTKFDGQNWEETMKKDPSIRQRSIVHSAIVGYLQKGFGQSCIAHEVGSMSDIGKQITFTLDLQTQSSAKCKEGCDITNQKSYKIIIMEREREQSKYIKYTGGCHCGAVRFEVLAPTELDVINCNICMMKSNNYIIVPENNFTIIKGQEVLSCYTFNTHQAKHTFCKICGVQSFYTPRSNPDGKAIAFNCIDSASDIKVNALIKFDGQNWEETMKNDTIIRRKSIC